MVKISNMSVNQLDVNAVNKRTSEGIKTLVDLPRSKEGIKIFCDCSDGSTYILFHHIDGMYSYCKTENGGTVHPQAVSKIKPVEGGYEFNND